MVKGMSGAMELVAGAKRVAVVMEHVAKDDSPRIREHCAPPLTGTAVDRIITDLGVADITASGLQLAEMAPGMMPEGIAEKAGAAVAI